MKVPDRWSTHVVDCHLGLHGELAEGLGSIVNAPFRVVLWMVQFTPFTLPEMVTIAIKHVKEGYLLQYLQ